MDTRQAAFSLKAKANAIEWKLLVFLVLLMNVKLAFKLVAIVVAFLLQPNNRFGFSLRHSRLPLFYPVVITIALINFIRYQNFSGNYAVTALTGLVCWLACIAAVHQLRLFTVHTATAVLHNTLTVFFILNVFFSFLNLAAIFVEIGFRNPFLYQGMYQKYFINTGDFIKGISFDTSTTNAIINCFGIVYFLFRGHYLLVFACMATLLLAASNVSNIIIVLVLIGLFAARSTREQKSIIVACLLLLVLFFSKVSPQNENYATGIFDKFVLHKQQAIVAPEKIIPIRERPDSLLNGESRKEKTAVLFLDSLERVRLLLKGYTPALYPLAAEGSKPALPADSIHTATYQWKRDTTLFQRRLLAYMHSQLQDSSHFPKNTAGKLLAFQQSFHFLRLHPGRILMGDGMGNFSSKLAFRATGLQMAGSFPARFAYCSQDFANNHLALYTYFLAKHADAHSIIHNPASVYDQLLTEYGLLGLLAFPVCYMGFFARHINKLSYGLPLLLMLAAFCLVDYWFEQLSVVALFELLLFINLKENNALAAA